MIALNDASVFLWSIPATEHLYGRRESYAVIAAALALHPSPTGRLRVGDWLGYRETPEATHRALMHTWQRNHRWIRTLHPLRRIPDGRIWVVRWDGLAPDDAEAMHRALESSPTYLGYRAIRPDDSAIAQVLLDTALGDERLRIERQAIAIPCYWADDDDCDGTRCAMDVGWVETLTPLGLPLRPYHPQPSDAMWALWESWRQALPFPPT
jgi:hypothetical protein